MTLPVLEQRPHIRAGQRVLLLQLDGKLPNLALMRIAAHCRSNGAAVDFRRADKVAAVRRDPALKQYIWDDYDHVFASAIFKWSAPVVRELKRNFPSAIVGGTWDMPDDRDAQHAWAAATPTVERLGIHSHECDYSIYPGYKNSIGFSQRGCRLKCSFCVVPAKEGAVVPAQSIAGIWRGDPYPRNIHLLDNDFFGQPGWADRIEELRRGNFKVCFNQGVNVRLMNEEQAAAVCTVRYYDDDFRDRRFYTAWDNNSPADEKVLFRGLEWLVQYGMKPDHIMVYMLIGWRGDTAEHREYRRARLREFGCRPYPMAYITPETPRDVRDELRGFQRWVIRRGDLKCSWEEFKKADYRPERVGLKEEAA